MQILIENQHRLLRGQTLELPVQYLERALLLALWRQVERRVAIPGGDPEQCRDQGTASSSRGVPRASTAVNFCSRLSGASSRSNAAARSSRPITG